MQRRTILPDAPSTLTTHCSLFDRVAYGRIAPCLAFCYTQRIDRARLADALARVLSDYGAYAAKIIRHGDRVSLEHGRAGAHFEVAHSRRSSRDLGEAAHTGHSKLACPSLSLLGAMRGKAPVLALRLTQTADGSVLGVRWAHLVGDVHSTLQFLTALIERPDDAGLRVGIWLPPALGQRMRSALAVA